MPPAIPGVSVSVTAAAAERAASWLARAWADRDVDDSSLAVEALGLGYLCRLLCKSTSGIADELESDITRAIGAPTWAAANLFTSLLAAAGALRHGNGVAASAEEYLRLLDELAAESLTGANGVLVCLALHGAESGVRVRARTGVAFDVHLLHGSADHVRRFLADIETSSAFGTTIIRVEPPVPILIEGAAIAALRAYDLPLAMRLLRARLYVCDRRSPGLSVGFDFLRSSQCDDGGFGDFDTALAQMAGRGDRNGPLQLKLPVTLQALWTMAELEDPAFRLVRSAFPGLKRRMSHQGMADADHDAD